MIGIFVLIGCAAVPKKDAALTRSSALEPSSMLKFADVPFPSGFKLLSADSYVFESGGVRVGLLKYQGKADIDRVINFYKEQMLMYNWDLLNVVEYGERLMNFDRINETCIISLLPKGKLITITISVGPKAQMPKKPRETVK
jgi:hypothetical protein